MNKRIDPLYVNPSIIEKTTKLNSENKPAVPFQNFFQEVI